MAVQAAFLRGNGIVAVQLTDSFMPLVTQKSCSSGEGGRQSKSYNLALFDEMDTDAEVLATLSEMQGKT